ncbi:MAG: ATP-binding cassette domain-containing protein, partial [Oscillospiraceae bacterium]|nr:ATP-binding cassette domain-containing protein [Oscillospiraceae bacterium]
RNTLEQLGILNKINVAASKLSGGQRQRVAIARALVCNPDIILADEPTGALDTKTSKEIIDIFSQLNEQGKTIIIITHDPKIASYCKKIIEISDGKIISNQNETAN